MWMLRSFISALALAVAVACGGGGGGGGNGNTPPAPTTGTLTLTVSGLPGPVNAAIAITGPGGFTQNPSGSGSWANLTPGGYTIAASNASTYVPTPPATQTATVTAGQTTLVNVVYAAPVVSVSVTPTNPAVGTNGTVQLSAVVSGTTNQDVTWTVEEGAAGGSISTLGLYTAPATPGIYHARATSQADTTKSAVANITVTPAQAPDFSLSAAQPSPIQTGGSGMTTLTAIRTNGHSAAITLSLNTNPQGITGNGSLAVGATTGLLTLNVPAAAQVGTYALTATGTDGLLTHSAAFSLTVTSAAPAPTNHPRLLFNSAGKSRLLAKKDANDPSWQALKARADTLATYTIFPYKFATRSTEPDRTIFYDYQGEGWLSASLPLAFAYQMTADTKYSSKLIQLAQEMVRAQSDPDNNPPIGLPPIQPDSYYASRGVASTLALIYDYCYDQLGAPLKSQMVTLMNQYFDDVRVNGYQAQQYSNAADGNYFGGHLYGMALMGYASVGDNARAQEMIDWARIRFDGTPGTVPPASVPGAWRTQCFDGGMRPAVSFDMNAPNITGSPFKGGFDFQAWSYGSEEYNRMIDYMLTVKSATGEDIVTPHIDWFSQILRAEKQALFPNRFMIDPTGDWGGIQGALISRGLPKRLAFVLAGTPDGPGAQHFAESGIAPSTIPGTQVYPAEEWAEFFFGDSSRLSTELVLPPYYTGFAPNYPQGAHSPGGTNGAIPYFIMRSDGTSTATWASIVMGSQWWDDHQHYTAGHLIMARGSDYLLVSATDWKWELDGSNNPIYGRSGVFGASIEYLESSLNNTLYFDDFGDFQGMDEQRSGGQSSAGIDEVVADELNQDFSYVRSDLSTAYNRAGDPADTPNRKLDFFYRNFVYLRAANTFVVYDQVQAKLSSNPRGAYKKQIRWHLPNRPTITGKVARLEYGQSRLFIDTVLPANASLAVVDEWRNPDPCDGPNLPPGCVPFGAANVATFRIEVRDPLNPLFIPFLTVIQPGSNTSTAPNDTQVASIDGKMIGVDISQAGGARNIVLFNNQSGQVPPPITSTSYNAPGVGSVSYTLLGVVPDARYTVVLSGGVVRVDQSPAGDKTSSPAGVLRFTL